MNLGKGTAIIVMLVLCLSVMAGAEIISPGSSVAPVTALPQSPAPDAKVSMVFWNAGCGGFLATSSPSGTMTHTITASQISIPAGGRAWFVTPLPLPSSVNSKPCTLSQIYLEWAAPSLVDITYVQAYSGDEMLYSEAHDDIHGGSASLEVVTIPIAGYPVKRGLGMLWSISNSDSTSHLVSVTGYGAKIKHRAS